VGVGVPAFVPGVWRGVVSDVRRVPGGIGRNTLPARITELAVDRDRAGRALNRQRRTRLRGGGPGGRRDQAGQGDRKDGEAATSWTRGNVHGGRVAPGGWIDEEDSK